MTTNRLKAATLLFLLSIIPLLLHADTPEAPPNLRARWINEQTTVMTWDAVAGAQGYRIYRFNGESGNWDSLSSVTQPFFRDTPGVTPPLQYAVSAYNDEGDSDGSAAEVAGGRAPFSMSSQRLYEGFGTLSRTNAIVAWSCSQVSGCDGILEYGPSPDALQLFGVHANYGPGHSFVLTNLTPGTRYCYRFTSSNTNRLGWSWTDYFNTVPTNIPPTAADVIVRYPYRDRGPIDITLAGNDPDHGGPLGFRVITQPSRGVLSPLKIWGLTTANLKYTPNPVTRGTDSFVYVTNDGEEDSAPATVTITNIYLNQIPVAGNATFTTAEDVPLQFSLPATDPDGDPLKLSVLSISGGTITGAPPLLTWIPPTNFVGQLFMTYWVSDAISQSSSIGRVDLTVTAVNDPPEAISQTNWTTMNIPLAITFSARDIDSNILTYRVIDSTDPSMITGSLSNLTFRPRTGFTGSFFLSFVANDRLTDSAPATLRINVCPPGVLPNQPASLAAATPAQRDSVTLQWTDNSSNETGFTIEGLIETMYGTFWQELGSVASNVRTWTKTGLFSGTIYKYRVRAFNAQGCSPYSYTLTTRTSP